ncbi:MAG: DUF4190 domain-containing protein, partial [Rhodococcus sp. (in: high G+C Gram-positive bacteria)]
ALIGAIVLAPLGIIFGHISLSQIKRTGEQGRGLALAGLIIGYIFTTLAVLSLVWLIVIANVVSNAFDDTDSDTFSSYDYSMPSTPSYPTYTMPSQTVAPPRFEPAPRAQPPRGDLGLSVPITVPACNGTGIVVIYSATDPATYAQEIEATLAANPGASYLRTDNACPSLRQQTDDGNAIYAVYEPAGASVESICAAVALSPSGSYGKWLDLTTDPSFIVAC